MSFFYILFRFINCHIVKPFLIRLSVVQCNFLYSSQNDKEVCVELFGKESTGKVFINNCTCTFQVVALAHNRDSAAATGNYKVTGVNHCTDCTDLNDLLRFWRSYNTTVSASCIFFHDIIIFFSHNISFFLRKEFTDWLGWCLESRIISIYTNLSDHCSNRNIMDSSVEQFFSQGILQVISDVSLAHCNTYRKWCVWLFLILMC